MIMASAVHDDRPQPGNAGRPGGVVGAFAQLALIVGERDQQNRIGSRHADTHDRSIREGTLIVVWVMNSIHKIPHTAPGRAIKMMSGSIHD